MEKVWIQSSCNPNLVAAVSEAIESMLKIALVTSLSSLTCTRIELFPTPYKANFYAYIYIYIYIYTLKAY